MENHNNVMASPFAKHQGSLKLGNNEIDVYVSDTKQRLTSLRATMKAIADETAETWPNI